MLFPLHKPAAEVFYPDKNEDNQDLQEGPLVIDRHTTFLLYYVILFQFTIKAGCSFEIDQGIAVNYKEFR